MSKTLHTYTIHEEVVYLVEAANPAEAMKLFQEDKNNAYLETAQLYITDHYGEERDEEDTEA